MTLERKEYRDPENGRLYEVLTDGDAMIVVGPPEGLGDSLEIPEPFATKLHNVLYHRRLYTHKDCQRGLLLGALMEFLQLDVQKLNEAYYKYEQEVVP